MTDYVSVQQGDLDDAATVNVVVGHDNLSNYVGYGLGLSGDFTTSPATVSLTEGKVFVLLPTQHAPGVGHDKHDCLVTAHYDARTKDLVTTGVNYIWARLNIGTRDSPKIDITGTDTAPSTDSVKIGTADTSTETVTPLNRDPDGSYETLSTNDLDVGNQITWPDGETTTQHPLTFGEPIENKNAYYDTTATSPAGVVNEASYAQDAGHASTADSATNADQAANSDLLEGWTVDEILAEAEKRTSYEWEPILDFPIEWTDTSVSVDIDIDFDSPFERYKVSLQVDNYSSWIDSLYLQVNDITGGKYRTINLEPGEYLEDPEKYDETRFERNEKWTIGDTMANSHSMHDFYLACPDAVKGTDNGPSGRFPVFNTGQHQTGTVRKYRVCGNLAESVDKIEKLRIFSENDDTALKAQVYGKNGF